MNTPATYDLPNHLVRLGATGTAKDALAALNADIPATEQITPDQFQTALGTSLKAVVADQQAKDVAAFESSIAGAALAGAIAKLKQPKA